MNVNRRKSISAIFEDGRQIDAAVRKAAREALRRHKLAGIPVVVWRNGRTIRVPPNKISVPTKAGLEFE